MKVILLRDVAKIGRRFEIVSVPDGYAQNKLIPQKDAEPATPANVKRVEEKAKLMNLSKAGEVTTVKEIADLLTKDPLVVKMEANDQGHLFQSVHVSDVVSAAKARDINLPEQFVKMDTVIKAVGLAEVTLVANDYKTNVSISVVAK
ncbi:MAG: 50S ribosomal protein L9 [Candidatus Paceibacterota bacterium]